MRVIGGRSRGRRLAARLPTTVRPTSDRVRESIFDILGSRGGVEGLRVVDLFCGSGALGVEALSRGAEHVTFVDSDPAALGAVRENLAAVGLDHEPVTVVRASLPAWLATTTAEFDLALCDPPYAFDDWAALLGSLRAGVVVVESGAPLPLPDGWPDGYMVTRERRYGSTLVTVAERAVPGDTQHGGTEGDDE